MSKKITKSGKTFFQNTMRMVNFSNRLKEENLMWRKYDKIKKRKLDESEDSDDNLTYENQYFRDKDDSMNSSMRMDISVQEANNLSKLRHLDESDVKSKKKKTPSKKSSKKSKTPSKKSETKSRENDGTSDSELSSNEEEDDECMIDNSFSSIDDRLLKTPKTSKTAGEKKIKLREKLFKKQMNKLKKKDQKEKKKNKKSKKSKK